MGSRKLDSYQLSLLNILPRDKCAASILRLAGLDLTLLEDLVALAMKFKQPAKAICLHLSSEGPNLIGADINKHKDGPIFTTVGSRTRISLL